MKTPLLHKEVEVRLVDTLKPEDGDGFTFGNTIAENGTTVTIARDIKSDVDFADTIIHELMHAVDFACGLDIPHHVVYTIAGGLTQMLVGLKLVHPPTWRATLESLQALENKKDG